MVATDTRRFTYVCARAGVAPPAAGDRRDVLGDGLPAGAVRHAALRSAVQHLADHDGGADGYEERAVGVVLRGEERCLRDVGVGMCCGCHAMRATCRLNRNGSPFAA